MKSATLAGLIVFGTAASGYALALERPSTYLPASAFTGAALPNASFAGPLEWVEQKAIESDTPPEGGFGMSAFVAGKTAMIGSPYAMVGTHQYQGAVFVFKQSGGVWTEAAKLSASDGLSADLFGKSVSFSGSTAVIGSYQADGGQGAAYIFTESNGVWTQSAKLTSPDLGGYDAFGFSVSISGNAIIIGAPNTTVYGNPRQGAAYVFTESHGIWTQAARLLAEDGFQNHALGHAVAFSGGTAFAGANMASNGIYSAQGAVYTFTETGGNWSQNQKLRSGDDHSNFFGASIAVDNGTAFIGAPGSKTATGESSRGSAHVFTESHGTWTESQDPIIASDARAMEGFGQSIALSGNKAAVGSVNAHVNGVNTVGAAFAYSKSNGVWRETRKLIASDGAFMDFHGEAVGVSGNVVVAGSPFTSVRDGTGKGGAYFYTQQLYPPQAALTPTSLAFNVAADETETQPLTLANAADSEALTFALTAHALASGAGGACSGPIVSWLAATPAGGSVEGDQSRELAVSANPAAGSLAPGTYSAELCLSTNEPAQPLIAVPISLSVTPAAISDRIFCGSFDGDADAECGV